MKTYQDVSTDETEGNATEAFRDAYENNFLSVIIGMKVLGGTSNRKGVQDIQSSISQESHCVNLHGIRNI